MNWKLKQTGFNVVLIIVSILWVVVNIVKMLAPNIFPSLTHENLENIAGVLMMLLLILLAVGDKEVVYDEVYITDTSPGGIPIV